MPARAGALPRTDFLPRRSTHPRRLLHDPAQLNHPLLQRREWDQIEDTLTVPIYQVPKAIKGVYLAKQEAVGQMENLSVEKV